MDGNGSAPRFPLPSEIADAPGAEDWRSMYPYFTRFQPEDDQRFWFYNSIHFPEPMPAFDTITAEVPYRRSRPGCARMSARSAAAAPRPGSSRARPGC
jgi:pyruvate,water dikinase